MLDFGTAVVVVLTLLTTYCYWRSRRPGNFPPGPFAWPFIGNIALNYNNRKIHQDLQALARKYGPIVGLQLGFYPAIVLSDAALIKQALVNHPDVFSDRPTWLPAQKFLTQSRGIINSSGQTWANAKKLTLSSMRELGFGSSTLEEKVLVEVENTIEELRRRENTTCCFSNVFGHASANIIASILFGERFQSNDIDLEVIVSSFNVLFETTFLSISNLLPTPLFFISLFFGFSIANKEYSAVQRVDKLVRKLFADQKATYDATNPRGLVDLFLQSGQTDERHLFAMVFDLFGAGFETTANTFMWTWYFMVKHPDVQEKCRQEIYEVIGSERLPIYHDKETMPFVTATLMEVQRLSNVASLALVHNTSKDTTLCGYDVPKNTIVIISTYNTHMDPTLWPDPEKFHPDRFLTEEGLLSKDKGNFIPFGVGRRSCLGENLAKMEMFLFFTAVLQKFRLTSDDPSKLPTLSESVQGFTLTIPDYLMKLEAV